MKNFAVIGDPIRHSFSSSLFIWIFKKLNIIADYSNIKVKDINLLKFLDNVRKNQINGFNITLPHKNNIIKYLDDVDIVAQKIGSVNIVRNINGKLKGYNSDWSGFCMSLGKNSVNIKNKEVILIGSGGSARALIYSLKYMGVKKIILLNRNINKAKLLTDNIVFPMEINDAEKIVNNNSIIINSTPVGMQTNQSPLDYGLIHKNQTLIDIIYTPYQTSFLKFGSEVGATSINGLDMFIYQALISFNIWFENKYIKQLHYDEIKQFLITIY